MTESRINAVISTRYEEKSLWIYRFLLSSKWQEKRNLSLARGTRRIENQRS